MSGKSDKKASKSTQWVYAYVFNGGVLKQNHCVVGVSTEHPETTVFNELKKYYGNDIKGAFYKCSKSAEDIKAGIKFKLSKECLTDILYNCGYTDAKKVLLEVTGLKQCSGTINVYKEKEGGDDEKPKDKTEPATASDAEQSDAESEQEAVVETKSTSKGKGKAKAKEVEAEPEKVETKAKGKGKAKEVEKEVEKETKESSAKSKSKAKTTKKV